MNAILLFFFPALLRHIFTPTRDILLVPGVLPTHQHILPYNDIFHITALRHPLHLTHTPLSYFLQIEDYIGRIVS